jgi:type II protein arginine methyltransferase
MRGEIGEAEMLARQVLARDPRHAGAMVELGRIAHRSGNKRAAADWLRKAAASEPANIQLHNELAFLLIQLGDRGEAFGAIMRALEIKPDDADAVTNKGTFYLHEGRLREALRAYRRAIEIDPLHRNARLNIAVALKDAVPPWHFPMMNDAPRNAAYDEAIRRVVPGRSVLEIGTGSGLLAMMAARAGARWVATCELVPWIAVKAADVVAANGLADRVKVIAKRSADLRIGPDLQEPAEILVSEVFGSAVLNEHVIPTVEDARARLLRPGATVIPSGARVRVYLAGGAALESHLFVDRGGGLHARALQRLRPTQDRPRYPSSPARRPLGRCRGLSVRFYGAAAARGPAGDRGGGEKAGALLWGRAVASPRSHEGRELREPAFLGHDQRRLGAHALSLFRADPVEGG